MVAVKSVKIDGESIHIFNSAIYIFEANTGYTLELDMIVTEVVVRKYRSEKTLIVEIELEDGRMLDSIMHVKTLPGGLPQLNLFTDLEDTHGYEEIVIVNENDAWFPNIEEGISLEEIRKVEMPIEDITLKLKLPIDQVEWLKKQKKKDLNFIMQQLIYEYWNR